MNLKHKKELVARTFGVGKGKVRFLESRLEEIKEAITKQDIRDLVKDKAIIIQESSGRRKIKSGVRRSTGNIRKKINKRKINYMIMTRKLRKYIMEIKNSGKISLEEMKNIRKRIKNKEFTSLNALKNQIKEMSK